MSSYAKFTYKDLQPLPEDSGKRYELHEGILFVSPTPWLDHQELVAEVTERLNGFVEPKQLGRVYFAVDVCFAEDTSYTPDVVFVSAAHVERILSRYVRGAPDLIAEITSPLTEFLDRGFKFQDYARFGVPEYWILDPVARTAEVYVLRGTGYELFGRFGETDTLRSEALPGLEIPLAEVWPEPLPED